MLFFFDFSFFSLFDLFLLSFLERARRDERAREREREPATRRPLPFSILFSPFILLLHLLPPSLLQVQIKKKKTHFFRRRRSSTTSLAILSALAAPPPQVPQPAMKRTKSAVESLKCFVRISRVYLSACSPLPRDLKSF